MVAAIGGLADLNAASLKRMGLLDVFVAVVEREWSRVFPLPLDGEDLPFLGPAAHPISGLADFTTCSLTSAPCNN